MNKKPKTTILLCVIVAAIAVGVFAYYSVMSNKAAAIGELNGKSYAVIKQAAEENGFSVSMVATDKELLKSLKHKSKWTVEKIKSDPWKRTTKVALSPSPEAVTRAFLDGIKQDDKEMINAAYEGGSFDIGEIAFTNVGETDEQFMEDQRALREEALYPRLMGFDYSITNERIDGEEATVSIDLNGYNIGAAYGKAVTDYFSEALSMALSGASNEQLQALLISKLRINLESLTSKEYKNSCDIKLIKSENTWVVKTINREDEAANILTCGLRNALDDLLKSY